MAPLNVINFIIVHELCHLRYRDRSDAFWNEVDRYCRIIEKEKSGSGDEGLDWIGEKLFVSLYLMKMPVVILK